MTKEEYYQLIKGIRAKLASDDCRECSCPNGSLAAAYGASELEPIDRVMTKIAGIAEREDRVCRDLVVSRKVKYKDGDLSIVEESVRILLNHGVRVQSWNELEVEQAPELG